MLKKIYVGNLPFNATEKQVRELFSSYGDVYTVDMVLDSENGQFRGFCFVEMVEDAAKKAIAGLKGQKVDGRSIKVSPARSDKAAPGNHPGSDLHLRTSRGLFGGSDEFGHRNGGNGRRNRGQKRGKNNNKRSRARNR